MGGIRWQVFHFQILPQPVETRIYGSEISKAIKERTVLGVQDKGMKSRRGPLVLHVKRDVACSTCA